MDAINSWTSSEGHFPFSREVWMDTVNSQMLWLFSLWFRHQRVWPSRLMVCVGTLAQRVCIA